MQQFISILKKELADYFFSPIAYIVIVIFLFVTGWLFFSTFFLFNQATMRNFFSLLPVIFSFVMPAITMRLFSEELHQGSYEILVTLPLTHRDIIVGKFAAAAVMTVAMLLPTVAYPVSISFMGDLDWGPVIGGYMGAVLLGGTFSAVGLFASSLTKNQIVAFIVSTLICISITLVNEMLFFFPTQVLDIVQYLSAGFHFRNISKGILDSRDIIYFVSVIFISLYATRLSLAHKK
jgi:ABC-2 type transport system permease protein